MLYLKKCIKDEIHFVNIRLHYKFSLALGSFIKMADGIATRFSVQNN